MKTLNEKISNILKEHKEGTAFFDALDFLIRGDTNILEEFYEFIWEKVFTQKNKTITTGTYNLILSGRFGISILNNYGESLMRNFNKVILTNGNIRKGDYPELYCNSIANKPFIFLDDSFYSGKTRNGIEKALQDIDPNIKIIKTFVIYDGSKEKQSNIYSMYRYHK